MIYSDYNGEVRNFSLTDGVQRIGIELEQFIAEALRTSNFFPVTVFFSERISSRTLLRRLRWRIN
jgi:hypothetical protein